MYWRPAAAGSTFRVVNLRASGTGPILEQLIQAVLPLTCIINLPALCFNPSFHCAGGQSLRPLGCQGGRGRAGGGGKYITSIWQTTILIGVKTDVINVTSSLITISSRYGTWGVGRRGPWIPRCSSWLPHHHGWWGWSSCRGSWWGR